MRTKVPEQLLRFRPLGRPFLVVPLSQTPFLCSTPHRDRLVLFDNVRASVDGKKHEKYAAKEMRPDVAAFIVQVENALEAPRVRVHLRPITLLKVKKKGETCETDMLCVYRIFRGCCHNNKVVPSAILWLTVRMYSLSRM